jgi:6,7-dimethyl-8-ribityllumazine synthase
MAQDDDTAVSLSALPGFLNSFYPQSALEKRRKKLFYVSLIAATAVIDGETDPFQAVSQRCGKSHFRLVFCIYLSMVPV